MAKKFTPDNAEGCEQRDLDALNAAYDTILILNAGIWSLGEPHASGAYKEWQERVVADLLFQYAWGLRGEELIAAVNGA